jgi:hypothetical protein
MSFDSEWSQLKADAAEQQQSTHTRLNHRDSSAVSVSEISKMVK